MTTTAKIILGAIGLALIVVIGISLSQQKGAADKQDGAATSTIVVGSTSTDGSTGGSNSSNTTGVACTMEAKLCPDGSYVGRTGPNCDFAACPGATSTPLLTGSITGQVTLSPVCPVERVPADPSCSPKPYPTTVVVSVSDSGKEVGRTTADNQGHFVFSFLPGTYDVEALGGSPYPKCESKTVTIDKGETVDASLSCDTGIR